MPVYHPIDIGRKFDCVYSELLDFRWTLESVVAYFQIPGDDNEVICVAVDSYTDFFTAHIMDDFEIGLPETTPNEGMVEGGFAYRVVGSALDTGFSEANKQIHYQFITGGKCLSLYVPEGIEVKIQIVKRPDWLALPERPSLDELGKD